MKKVYLGNYLLKLDNPYYIRKGSDSIRIYFIGKFIKQIYKDLKGYKSISSIEKDTKRCHQTYSNWILEKTGISIQELYNLCLYWKRTCQKSEKEFNNLWNIIFSNVHYFGCVNGKTIKLPKYLDYRLSYLIGYILGDGHLADPNRSYDKLTTYNSEVRITDGDKETFTMLSKIFEQLFDYKPKIYSEKSKTGRSFYRFVIRSKPLHRFLMEICDIPTGAKHNKIKIPDFIKDKILKKWLISGFFDADGCLRLYLKKYPEISISQLNSKILFSIIKFSEELGIKWNGPYKCNHPSNHGYIIRISNKLTVKKFLNTFKLLNPKKLNQIKMLKNYLYP